MGLLDRLRRRHGGASEEGPYYGVPVVSEPPVSPSEASIKIDAPVASRRKKVVVRETTQEEANKAFERGPEEYEVSTTLEVGGAEGVVTEPIRSEERIEVPSQEGGTPVRRLIGAMASKNDKTNWGANSVGERAFSSYKEARTFAKAMRQQGYTAKLVKLKDGTYKVYIYRKVRGGSRDPLKTLNIPTRALKSSRSFPTLSSKSLKSFGLKRGDFRLTMPDFNASLKGGLDFDMDMRLSSLEDVFSDFNLLLGGDAYGQRKRR